jgi:DNA invertase Pin-like site-specific DNA recombinase
MRYLLALAGYASTKPQHALFIKYRLTIQTELFTGRMFGAVNAMMLDVLAAVARKDYDDRRRRQAQGQAKAKAEGKYRGRPEDTARNAGIAAMLKAGSSWSAIEQAFGCSRATIAKIAARQRSASAS